MTDIALVFDPKTMSFDYALDGAQLLQDDGLTTAIYLSWFCDKRADPGDVLPEEQPGPFGLNRQSGGDRRGWWGDFMTPATARLLPGQPYPVPAYRIGSRFWMFRRRKMTAQLVSEVQAEAVDCLSWMKTDGLAKSITATARAYGNHTIICSGRVEPVAGAPLAFRLPAIVGGASSPLPETEGGGQNGVLGVFVLDRDRLS